MFQSTEILRYCQIRFKCTWYIHIYVFHFWICCNTLVYNLAVLQNRWTALLELFLVPVNLKIPFHFCRTMRHHKRMITSPFPRRKFRLMAGTQMLLGIACIVLGGIDMVLSRHRMNLCYESRESQYERYPHILEKLICTVESG